MADDQDQAEEAARGRDGEPKWVIAVGGIVVAVVAAVVSYLQHEAHEEQRQRDRDAMLAAIRQAADKVISEFLETRMEELRGELEGFISNYGSYHPDPDNDAEEVKLVLITDESARIIGQLGQHIDGWTSVSSDDDDRRLALDAWPIYISLICLRAQALAEREVTYGAGEAKDALPSIKAGIARIEQMLVLLQQESDANFGPIKCGPDAEGEVDICWFTEKGKRVNCWDVERCETLRDQHMNDAFRSREGVSDLSVTITALRSARDVLAATPPVVAS
jgi:hypothetical protein